MISRVVPPSRSIEQSNETTFVDESNVAEFNTRPGGYSMAFGELDECGIFLGSGVWDRKFPFPY